jgi:hypothetical protein
MTLMSHFFLPAIVQSQQKQFFFFTLFSGTVTEFLKTLTLTIDIYNDFTLVGKNCSPVNRDIKMAPPCKRYRKVYTWQVSSIRHIINIAEFATLAGCRSPRHTGE